MSVNTNFHKIPLSNNTFIGMGVASPKLQEIQPTEKVFQLDEVEKVAVQKWDGDFLKDLCELIGRNAENQIKLKQILKHPLITQRLNKIDIPWSHYLDTLVNFIYENQHLLNHSIIQKFVARQCVHLQLSLSANSQAKVPLFADCTNPDQLIKLLTHTPLPKSIYEPLKAVAFYFFKNETLPVQQILSPQDQTLYKGIYTRNKDVALLAAEVANTIDESLIKAQMSALISQIKANAKIKEDVELSDLVFIVRSSFSLEDQAKSSAAGIFSSVVVKRDGIKEIASLMKELENHFNAPVEIEFVVEGKKFHIVQLRPITKK